jgi:adenosyl cobinamide kinase/adenosyl cobinamide phosphate guanylyltransferase
VILVIGGVNQGKLLYTMSKWGISPEQVATTFENAENALVFDHFQQAVQKSLESGEDLVEKLEYLMKRNPQLIFLCDEVGCGVVPMDREERVWRETVGRLCCRMAGQAERVDRVFCGLAMRLK